MDNQAVAEVKLDSICFTESEDGLQDSLVGYLDLATLERFRKRHFRGWNSTTNEPRAGLCRTKLRLVMPTDAAEDPYMAAVLIAAAQARRLALQSIKQQPATPSCGGAPGGSDGAPVSAETTPAATSFKVWPPPSPPWLPFAPIANRKISKVHLLVLSSQPPAELFLYQATISSAFLDKFEKSSCASPCNPIRILYDRFPLRRPQRLVEQLPRVLGWAPEQRQVRKVGGGSLPVEDKGDVENGGSVQDEAPEEEGWEWE